MDITEWMVFDGSNMHIAYVRFREIGFEPTNREESMSEKAKTRSRNLVYLCWCLVWLGEWFLFQTFEDLDSAKDRGSYCQEIKRLIDDPEII